MEIEFDINLFNELFFEYKELLSDNKIRYIWTRGGSSAGKSHSFAQVTIVNMLCEIDYNSLVFRKIGSDIKDSIYRDFKNVIKQFGLEDYFICQQNLIKCIPTGNYTTFKGLDDESKIRGISGFKKIFVDECTQLEYSEYDELTRRLRGKPGQQLIFAYNPISELSYVKKEVLDNEILIDLPTKIKRKRINDKGDFVELVTTYEDNKWIVGPNYKDTHAIAKFEKYKQTDFNQWNIFAMAEFGSLRTGTEFFKHFRSEKHTMTLEYNPELPLWICLDENSLPYLACAIYQLKDGYLRQIDEVALDSPRNTLRATCEEIIGRYEGHQGGMFITGDKTSLKQDTKQEKGQNFFTLVLQYLEQFRPELKLNSVNPSVVMSKLFVDAIFNGDYENIQIGIDSNNCKKSIYDYLNTKEDAEGKADKKMITNKVTGARYQEFAHFSDTLRYIVTLIFKSEYQVFLQGGKKRVLTVGRREKQ